MGLIKLLKNQKPSLGKLGSAESASSTPFSGVIEREILKLKWEERESSN